MKIKIITLLALFIGCISSCSDDDPIIGPDNPDGPFKKTVLLYMVAENNLSSAGYNNIENMMKGSNATNLKDKNVLIYFDPVDDTTDPEDEKYDPDKGKPTLLQLRLNNYSEVVLDTIQRFEEHNSASVEVLSKIISLMSQYESESYSLILWGHATNWFPSDFQSKFTVLNNERNSQVVNNDIPPLETCAYGDDNKRWLEIDELAEAIPDQLFDMILFDACYMGSVEVAYELRNKAKHFIAASSEIISFGFPYNRVMDYLLGTGSETDYRMICQEYYDYYNSMTGQYRSATIAWTRLDKMTDLATAVHNILASNQEAAKNVNLTPIQNFDRDSKHRVMRDLEQYIEAIAPASEYSVFQSVLEEVVPFEKHTDIFIDYAINRHCGLTIYPYYSYNYTINLDYQNLAWYKAVYK